MLKKNLVWQRTDTTHTARWRDVELAYEIDNVGTCLRIMPKLTEGHVNRHKIRKMKVSCVTQVFSHSVAAGIDRFATDKSATPNGIHMPSEAVGTVAVLKCFDSLFDSINGTSLYADRSD